MDKTVFQSLRYFAIGGYLATIVASYLMLSYLISFGVVRLLRPLLSKPLGIALIGVALEFSIIAIALACEGTGQQLIRLSDGDKTKHKPEEE